MNSLFSNLVRAGGILVLLSAGLCAGDRQPTREELEQRIKFLEEQNAKLAVDATFYRMQSENSQKLYQAALKTEEPVTSEMPAVPAKMWKAEVALGATASSGNNDSYQVNLAAKGTRKTKIDELILALSADVGGNEGIQTSEKGRASADYRRNIDDFGKWYWLVVSSLERDQLSDLDYRFTGGPGAGYRFYDTEKFKFSLESGPVFVAEKNSNDPVDYSVRGRVGDRLEFQMTSYAKLFQNSEVLFNFQDNEDYLINNEIGVESSLTKVLSLRVYGKHRYENVPAVGKEQNDFSLISALVYKFE